MLFLGSTIGNFDRPAAAKFLREVRHILQPGDSLLLGTDLEKPVPQLLAAYDDPLGVTAAFNLNLLARINRELDADFVLEQFEHLARFNPEARSVEMHLRSQQGQNVTILRAGLTVSFLAGETIWTESGRSLVRKRCLRSPGKRAFFARRSGSVQMALRREPFRGGVGLNLLLMHSRYLQRPRKLVHERDISREETKDW